MSTLLVQVGLLAWATSCGGLGCAVAADKREVPDVDNFYVEKSFFWEREVLTPLQLEKRVFGDNILRFSIGRGSGVLKGLSSQIEG